MAVISIDIVKDDYLDDLKRMALALTSAQMAKDVAVKEHGIGEELSTHFLGWSASHLSVICQMGGDLQKTSHENRIKKSSLACSIIRKTWWVTSLTMVAEGFCSLDANMTKGMDLSIAYLNKDLPVYECITVTHVNSEAEDDQSVALVAVPYKCEIGRNVRWNETLVYPSHIDQHIFPSHYSVMLKKSLSLQPEQNIDRDQIEKARSEIKALGFAMQEI